MEPKNNNNLPEPKIRLLNVVKQMIVKDKQKTKKHYKYLDQLYKKDDVFLKNYFKEN
tara:strand:+ start:315 stop:485 length:171 start_codon:yes stop_codon:yes gene_type:complete